MSPFQARTPTQCVPSGAARRPLLRLQLDGLLPLADMLIDRPLPKKEFNFEKQRLKSRQPRWPSLLQGRELAQLRDVCPGASRLIEFRKQCVGYFLAE